MNGCKIIRSENVWSLLSCATSKTVWAEVNMLTGDKAECGHFQLRFIYVLMLHTRWENDADDGHDVCWWSGLLQAVPVMTVSVVPACVRHVVVVVCDTLQSRFTLVSCDCCLASLSITVTQQIWLTTAIMWGMCCLQAESRTALAHYMNTALPRELLWLSVIT